MTLILRPLTAPSLVDLGRAGICRVALVVQEVGAWGHGPWRVEYLRPTQPEDDEDDDERTQATQGTAGVPAVPRVPPAAPGVLLRPL